MFHVKHWTPSGRRHVADSLQVLPLLPTGSARIFDLGSGGGFPGAASGNGAKGLGATLRAVRSRISSKVAFLRTAIRELGPDAEVDRRRASKTLGFT